MARDLTVAQCSADRRQVMFRTKQKRQNAGRFWMGLNLRDHFRIEAEQSDAAEDARCSVDPLPPDAPPWKPKLVVNLAALDPADLVDNSVPAAPAAGNDEGGGGGDER